MEKEAEGQEVRLLSIQNFGLVLNYLTRSSPHTQSVLTHVHVEDECYTRLRGGGGVHWRVLEGYVHSRESIRVLLLVGTGTGCSTSYGTSCDKCLAANMNLLLVCYEQCSTYGCGVCALQRRKKNKSTIPPPLTAAPRHVKPHHAQGLKSFARSPLLRFCSLLREIGH